MADLISLVEAVKFNSRFLIYFQKSEIEVIGDNG